MKVVERKASDNKYLHRDFHISMNMLMEYIYDKFGSVAITEYLKQFSAQFHKQRKKDLLEKGLGSLKDYFEKIYSDEEWPVIIEFDDELKLEQSACPGITHIQKNGYKPVDQYIETYTTVYEELCSNTPFEYEMIEFDKQTGACRQVFRRRNR